MFKKIHEILLGMVVALTTGLAVAGPADSTGSELLSGASGAISTLQTNITNSVITSMPAPADNTIQAWLTANHGRMFVLPTYSYARGLYVTSSSACMAYYYGGWNVSGPCLTVAAPKIVSMNTVPITSPWGATSEAHSLTSLELTSYGFVGSNLYGTGIYAPGSGYYDTTIYNAHVHSNSSRYY